MMLRRLIVLSSALPGHEEEFERWYDEIHLRDIAAINGVVSARRMRVEATLDDKADRPTWQSLAIYEFNGAPDDVLRGIREQRVSGAMQISPALDRSSVIKMIVNDAGFLS